MFRMELSCEKKFEINNKKLISPHPHPSKQADFEIETNDEYIPSDPHYAPHCIPNDHFWTILQGSEKADDDEYYLQEVTDYGRPHVT